MFFNPGGFDPVLFATKWQFAVLNNVTKVTGTHTLKGGFFFEHVTNNQPGNGNSNGNITLDTTLTQSSGNAFADLLLGRIGSYNEQTHERAPQHRLQPVGVLRAGHLALPFRPDVRLRRALLLHRSVVRPRRPRPRGVGSVALPERHLVAVPGLRLERDRRRRARRPASTPTSSSSRASAPPGISRARVKPSCAAASASSSRTTRSSRTPM